MKKVRSSGRDVVPAGSRLPAGAQGLWAAEYVQALADDAARARNHSEAIVRDRLGNHSARAERSGVVGRSTPGLRPYALGDRDLKSRTEVRTNSGAPIRRPAKAQEARGPT
jgi:hypothetical protein